MHQPVPEGSVVVPHGLGRVVIASELDGAAWYLRPNTILLHSRVWEEGETWGTI